MRFYPAIPIPLLKAESRPHPFTPTPLNPTAYPPTPMNPASNSTEPAPFSGIVIIRDEIAPPIAPHAPYPALSHPHSQPISAPHPREKEG